MEIESEYDLIILGSGVAGLSAAVAAHQGGLRALVIEKSALVGGGTTNSYGLIWVGANHIAQAEGYSDSRAETITYMNFLAGGEAIEANLATFIDQSPVALKFFEECGLCFRIAHGVKDHYYGVAPGSKIEGRSLEVDLISGFDLGDWRDRVRMSAVQPNFITVEEQIKWGGINRAPFWNQKIVRERQQQDMRGKGVGLICQLLKAALDRKIPIVTEVAVEALVLEGNTVSGIKTERATIKARKGVMLATGGYESNPDLVRSFEGVPGWVSMCPKSVTGDGMVLGCQVGAAVHMIRNNMQFFLGFDIPTKNPKAEPEFHLAGIIELCSPHTMVVNKAGSRFSDEAYFQGMISSLRHFDAITHQYTNLPCFLIFDRQYASKYSFAGLPAGQDIPKWVASDNSIKGLATKLGIDALGLENTVRRFNKFVTEGRDHDFHRGELAWRLANQSGKVAGENQSLGMIEEPPFFGLELHPSAAGSAGLLTNTYAQVLNASRDPIVGLYATGNTAARTEFGAGYQAGLTLASGMTYSYLATRHMLMSN
jgi:3-oxosteroid 1-dehydrogenase